jgi:hypothetical protein
MAPPPDITTLTLPNADAGMFYQGTINVSGGTGTVTLSVPVGSLPAGFSLAQPGILPFVGIQGTPTTPGVYSFTVRATDSSLLTDDQAYVIRVEGGGDYRAAALAPATFGSDQYRYEIFQQQCIGKDPEEAIRHAIYESDQGDDGYGTSVLYGAETGLRSFKLKFPMLARANGQSFVTIDGVTMSPVMYVWQLYRKSRRTGRPIVIQSPVNDQYYLVKFADPEMSLARFTTMLFSTGLSLRQVRIEGVSIFDPRKMPGLWGWYGRRPYDIYLSGSATDGGASHPLTLNGNVTEGGTVLNGFPTARFNGGATNTGYLNTTEDPTIYEAFFVMKMNEATFSNYGGLLTADSGNAALVGVQGTTKFTDFGLGSNLEYRLNGVQKANDDLQAPMNAFGLVHARWRQGITLNNLQIGKDRGFAAYLEMDLAEAVLFSTLNPIDESLELAESVMEIYNL